MRQIQHSCNSDYDVYSVNISEDESASTTSNEKSTGSDESFAPTKASATQDLMMRKFILLKFI